MGKVLCRMPYTICVTLRVVKYPYYPLLPYSTTYATLCAYLSGGPGSERGGVGAHPEKGAVQMADHHFGEEIKRRREAAGFSSVNQFRDAVCGVLGTPPPQWPHPEKFRRIERGDTAEDRVEKDLIAAMATVLDCSIADISPLAAETWDQMKELVNSVRRSCSERVWVAA